MWLLSIGAAGLLVVIDVLSAVDEHRDGSKSASRMKLAAKLFIASLCFKALRLLAPLLM